MEDSKVAKLLELHDWRFDSVIVFRVRLLHKINMKKLNIRKWL